MYSRYYKNKNLQVQTIEEVEELFKKLGIEYEVFKNFVVGKILDSRFWYGESVFVEWKLSDNRFTVFPDVVYFSKTDKTKGFTTANLRKRDMYANSVEDIVEIKQNIIRLLREKVIESSNNAILSALSHLD